MATRMVDVLEANGTERAMVVFGHDGLDELSTVAASTVLETRVRTDGEGYDRLEYEIDSTELGMRRAVREELRGGTAEENAGIAACIDHARFVFGGEGGARRDFVSLNAAAALVVAGTAPDISSGIDLALSLIDDGSVTRTLDALIQVSSALRT